MDKEKFVWKSDGKIFNGVGIYHLTFVVVNRLPLLGRLVPLEQCMRKGVRRKTEMADVEYTPLGLRIHRKVEELEQRHPELKICTKVIMEDHLHLVIWMRDGFEDSVKLLAKGFSQGCSKIAREVAHGGLVGEAPSDGANDTDSPLPESDPYECGNGAHTLFSKPFIRTLSRKNQLESMIRYVNTNPDNAWRRRMHPDMYVIRRNMEYAGLHFDCMGKERLLAYPDRQVIALSRSLTDEEILYEVNKALNGAERGMVTLTGAINKAEQTVAKAIREAGYPLVVMMLEGFPPEGSEAARYYHPGGVYHKVCGEGRLYLMAPLAENYSDPILIARTDATIKAKDEAKGDVYRPLPHDSKRWRMIAGNVMLEMVTSYDNDTAEAYDDYNDMAEIYDTLTLR